MKNGCKYDCTDCNIPGCQRTLFCHYCHGNEDISGARRSLFIHLVVFIILIVLTVITVLSGTD